MRNLVAGSLAVGFIGVLVVIFVARRSGEKPPGSPPADLERPMVGAPREERAVEPSTEVAPSPSSGPAGTVPEARPAREAKAFGGSPAAPKAPTAPPPPDPGDLERRTKLARNALTHVGADPDAEEVWLAAIYDPKLSEHTRQDLIEDLNEEGFPDPRHPTAQDLPLILRRIEIIEELAPFAMDEINSAAFAEAHKDLVNMYVRVIRQ
jgi:hypothetical protein